MKRGELAEKLGSLIQAAGAKGITTERLAAKLKCNRQYVRKLIRTKLEGKVVVEGVSSPSTAPVYRWKK